MSNAAWIRGCTPILNPNQVIVSKGLSWNVRHSILSGVASGLEYLHEKCAQCVLHRDIKSSNVMLDADFNPYLGDLGLARLIDHPKVQKTTMVAGTLGYMAPEMHYIGKATKQTDVYALGMLVLEVVCGRPPLMVDDSTHDGVDQAGDDKYLYVLDGVHMKRGTFGEWWIPDLWTMIQNFMSRRI